jgi:hypothetical protein
MSRSIKQLLALTAVLTSAACSDLTNSSGSVVELSSAFQTMPLGFSAASSSFDPAGDAGMPFYPESMRSVQAHTRGPGGEDDGKRQGDRHDGFGFGGIRGLLMGGGLGPDFIGALAFGNGKGRGPFWVYHLPDSCTFNETTGRVTCPPKDRGGLTVNLSFAFKNQAGEAQAKFDSLSTDLVNAQTDISGTKTRHDGAVTSVVDHESDRTVSGLAPGSTERTVNGTAAARESTTGTRDEITFTAQRVAYDTTRGLVIPLRDGHPTLPSAGTVIRRMTVTIQKGANEPRTMFRREQATFDGTNVIKIQITQDDVTKNCTLTVPGKRLVCEE